MATTNTGPDLTAATAAVTKLMDDRCTITRPASRDSLVLNRATGVLAAATTAAAIYTGVCKLRPKTSGWEELGGAEVNRQQWDASIPGTSLADLQVGDVWTHTASRRDPLLVGKVFSVKEIVYSTFLVQRRLVLEELS